MEMIRTQADSNSSRLKNAYYAGRGMVQGVTPSGKELVQVYWTMGRSANSRNRRLIRVEGGIKTVLKDTQQQVVHEDLIVYHAALQTGSYHIISNGRQTDTVRAYIADGKTWEEALGHWSFEADPPILTARITGLVDRETKQYKLSIIKAIEQNEALPARYIFSYQGTQNGCGHCIHTYDLERETMPFVGEPYWMPLWETVEENAAYYWSLLPDDKRVGLYVKHIDVASGAVQDTIINE